MFLVLPHPLAGGATASEVLVRDGTASIEVFKCQWLKAAAPTTKGLAHLEQSDIVVMGDGSNNYKGYQLLEVSITLPPVLQLE